MKRKVLLWSVVSFIFIGLYALHCIADPVDEHTRGLWLFDEGSGNVAVDSSGNGNDGDIVLAKWVEGKFGGALEFDGIAGVDDYVEIQPSQSLNITGRGLTMEAWVFVNSHQADNIRIIQGYNFDVSGGWSLVISQANNSVTCWIIGVIGFSQGPTMVPTEEWAHIAVTFDGKTVKNYLNGELDLEADSTASVPPRGLEEPLYISRHFLSRALDDPENLDGIIDEVRISSIARTQAEIQETMEVGLQIAVESLNKVATTWGSLKNEY